MILLKSGRGKLLDHPNGSIGMCSVKISSSARLVAPRVEASWRSLLAPIHHSEAVSIVSFPLHVQLNFPRSASRWVKQT